MQVARGSVTYAPQQPSACAATGFPCSTLQFVSRTLCLQAPLVTCLTATPAAGKPTLASWQAHPGMAFTMYPPLPLPLPCSRQIDAHVQAVASRRCVHHVSPAPTAVALSLSSAGLPLAGNPQYDPCAGRRINAYMNRLDVQQALNVLPTNATGQAAEEQQQQQPLDQQQQQPVTSLTNVHRWRPLQQPKLWQRSMDQSPRAAWG